MPEEKVDANAGESSGVASSAASAEGGEKPISPAEGVKTEGQKPAEGAEEKKPWHEDPRFKDELSDIKVLKEIKETYGYKSIEEVREAMKSLKEVSDDPDFPAFLALKAQKEKIEAQSKDKGVDISRMTAEEFVEYNRKVAEEAARKVLGEEREAVKVGDQFAVELNGFAQKVKIPEDVLKKEYIPAIFAHYEKVPAAIRDSYIRANPPVNVLKLLYFDKAKEAGVAEYKGKVEESKKANFEEEGMGSSKGKPKDDKSRFEENWGKLFGNSAEVPLTAFGKSG